MSAYCENCQRYVNQYCDRCGENFGTVVCEKYACGGTMICPICGGNNLKGKKESSGPDPYDPRSRHHDKAPAPPPGKCMKCGFDLTASWKYCPECGNRRS